MLIQFGNAIVPVPSNALSRICQWPLADAQQQARVVLFDRLHGTSASFRGFRQRNSEEASIRLFPSRSLDEMPHVLFTLAAARIVNDIHIEC